MLKRYPIVPLRCIANLYVPRAVTHTGAVGYRHPMNSLEDYSYRR